MAQSLQFSYANFCNFPFVKPRKRRPLANHVIVLLLAFDMLGSLKFSTCVCKSGLWLTSKHVTKFGWILLSDLCLRRLVKKQNFSIFGWINMKVPRLAVCGPKFMNFGRLYGTPCSFQRHYQTGP